MALIAIIRETYVGHRARRAKRRARIPLARQSKNDMAEVRCQAGRACDLSGGAGRFRMKQYDSNKFLQDRGFAVAVLLEKIVREAYENRLSSEVQPLQWSILRYLGSEQEDRCTVGWISSFLGVTHAPVVRAIQTLQKRNFVMQIANPLDARSKIVKLTDEGWQQLSNDPLLAVANRIDGLSEEDRLALMSAVRLLINRDAKRESQDHVVHPSG